MLRPFRRPTLALAAVLAALASINVVPAEATTPREARAQRDAVRRERAAAAGQLNLLEASDDQLEAAVAALDEYLAAQTAAVEEAQRAVDAALTEMRAAQVAIEATSQRITELEGLMADQAVAAYIRPSVDVLVELGGHADLTEASRRQVLLDTVTGRNRDVTDELSRTREDLHANEQRAAAAAAAAEQRRAELDAQRAETARARDEQQRLRDALNARIAEVHAEIAALEAQESALSALIRQAEAEAAAAARARATSSRSAGAPAPAPGAVSAAGLSWPLRGAINSGYGSRWGRMHQGLDIDGDTGDPIMAAAAGTVIFAGVQSGYGNVVIISHPSGISTLYAHQSRIAVSKGQQVDKGQVIGYVGSTGRSTGPHLHFEVRVNGSPRNPRPYLP